MAGRTVQPAHQIHPRGRAPAPERDELQGRCGATVEFRRIILGYLEPEQHTLQVGNTVIKAGTRASPRTMVPSVKILGLGVYFAIRNNAKMLPSLLRCFPNVETLHLESKETYQPTGKLSNKFWKEVGAIECVQSHIKLMVFYGFRGERGELSFLKFFLESARMLTKLVIVCNKRIFTSVTEANSKVQPPVCCEMGQPRFFIVALGECISRR